ncbi:YhcN/YlaJ family sporulation lipoprotein [Bacillus timonensis]|nr:YhcN/YlaJ family sporulation lipoprotein [Bacillus timonensis]
MNADNAELYEESGHTINVADRNDLYSDGDLTNDDSMSNFGYVRHQKSPIPGDANIYASIPKLNREKVADVISKMATQLPNVEDVGTLVTDEEVLIVYSTDSKNRFETADQVKKTALSVVPRYYHVYVSDNPILMRDIERFGVLDADSRNVDQIITSTIQRMLDSPQGRKISDGENENGEMDGGMNNEYERKMNNNNTLPENYKNPNTNVYDNGEETKNIETRDVEEGNNMKGNGSDY